MEAPAAVVAQPPRQMRWVADLSLLGIAAVWGATFFMIKDVTSTFPVLTFLALRFTLASAALLPLALRVRHWPTRTEWIWGIAAGGAFCGGFIFQTFSLRLIDSGRTGFITGLYVVLVPILALLLLRHALTPRVIVGAVLALVGLTWLFSYAPSGKPLGDVLAFLCALSFALQIIAVDKFPQGADWRVMSLVQSGCVAVVCSALLPVQAVVRTCQTCTALLPFADPFPGSLPLVVFVVAAFTGLVATAMALALQVWAQRLLPPSDTALIFAMESPFSALFGFLFRGEMLTLGGLLGCGLILAGMLTTALNSEDKIKQTAEESDGHRERGALQGWSRGP